MDLETGDTRALNTGPGYDMLTAGGWSLDGSSLVIATSGSEPFPDDATHYDPFHLILVDLEGNARPLVDLPGEDSYATWTPDGRHVLCPHRPPSASVTNDDYDTVELDVRTGLARTLLGGTGNQCAATVSPDGSRMVFDDSADGAEDLWMSDREGNDRIRLTRSPGAGGA